MDCRSWNSPIPCSYHSNGTNFIRVPESVLASLHSSIDCTWVEGIVNGSYTTEDVWRDLLPATIYNPNFTNCYSEQFIDYFNISVYSMTKDWTSASWFVPCGLGSLVLPCIDKACHWAYITGNPDMAGTGVS